MGSAWDSTRDLILRKFLKSAAYVSIFLLVLLLADTRARARQLALVLISVVFAEALWGIVGLYPVWSSPGSRATGTYINPNNFAGLLEIGIGLTLGLLIAQFRHPVHVLPLRTRLKSWLHAFDVRNRGLLVYVALVTMIAALVLSASRGGVISILLAVIAASALAALLRDRGAKGTSRIFRIAGSALVVALVAFGAEVLEKRIEAGFFEAEGWMLMREASYRMIADYPIFGSGAGSWEFLYPAYRDPETYIPLRTLHAHNDHLELLAEQGVIGYLFIASAIVLSLREMIPRKSGGRDPLIEGILFGSVIAVLSLLIHAWADFNFQIPANAAWFFAVLALGLVAARRLDEGRYPSARPGSAREPSP